MKPLTTSRTKPFQGRELLVALEQLKGMPVSRVLRACGYVMRTGKGQRVDGLAPLCGLWAGLRS